MGWPETAIAAVAEACGPKMAQAQIILLKAALSVLLAGRGSDGLIPGPDAPGGRDHVPWHSPVHLSKRGGVISSRMP